MDQRQAGRQVFWLEALVQDLRFALRTFYKSPGFTAAAVFAVALGISANTAMFSVVNAVLLNSLPLRSLRDPSRIVMLWEQNPSLNVFAGGSQKMLLGWW